MSKVASVASETLEILEGQFNPSGPEPHADVAALAQAFRDAGIRRFVDGGDAFIGIPESAYIAARELLIYEAGYSVGEALKLLGMWPETKR